MTLRSLCYCLVLPLSAQSADATLADVFCDDSARLEQQLANVQGATKRGQGLRGPDAVLEVWIVPRSGDWTLVQTYANGTSCVVAMGEHWQSLIDTVDPA